MSSTLKSTSSMFGCKRKRAFQNENKKILNKSVPQQKND
jgi:hypothetical protein